MSGYSKLILSSTNKLLDYFSKVPEVPCGFPSNNKLAKELKVSNTSVIKIIEVLCKKGIARKDGTNKILLRKPKPSDYFSSKEMGNSKTDMAERLILEKISAYELKPGDRFSELELARELDVNTVILREALIKIAQIGIISKHPHQKWKVIEFSSKMLEEIADIRKLFEGYAIPAIQKLPESSSIWGEFKELEMSHCELLEKPDISFDELTNLERLFHITLIKACDNRFIEESYNSIFTLINFHLWQIEYDRPKIIRVFKQHLAILRALLNKDFPKAMEAMELHLEHAKESMKTVNKKLENDKKLSMGSE